MFLKSQRVKQYRFKHFYHKSRVQIDEVVCTTTLVWVWATFIKCLVNNICYCNSEPILFRPALKKNTACNLLYMRSSNVM